jgi:hypothetical protein
VYAYVSEALTLQAGVKTSREAQTICLYWLTGNHPVCFYSKRLKVNMKKSLLLAALLSTSLAAIAQTAPPSAPASANGQAARTEGTDKAHQGTHGRRDAKKMTERHLAKLDTDKDGKVSRQEFLARQSEVFSKADANSDGFVTQEEMAAMHEKHHAEMSARRDARKGAHANRSQEAQQPAVAPTPSPTK